MTMQGGLAKMAKTNWGTIAAVAGIALQGIVISAGLWQWKADTQSAISVMQFQVSSMQADLSYLKQKYMDRGFADNGRY